MVIFWTLFIFLEGVTLDIEHLVQILTVASSHLHMINALKKGCSHGRAMFFFKCSDPVLFFIQILYTHAQAAGRNCSKDTASRTSLSKSQLTCIVDQSRENLVPFLTTPCTILSRGSRKTE